MYLTLVRLPGICFCRRDPKMCSHMKPVHTWKLAELVAKEFPEVSKEHPNLATKRSYNLILSSCSSDVYAASRPFIFK